MTKTSLSMPGEVEAVLFLVLILLAVALGSHAEGASPGDASSPVSLELLSEYDIPGGSRFEGTCIGGLSALDYDASRDRYFAISDSRRNARFYTLRLAVSEDEAENPRRPRINGVTFESVVGLETREGLPYPQDRVDPEGFVLIDEQSAFISSEGVAAEGVPPFVDRIDVATGEWLASAPIPLAFRPRHHGESQVQGVRPNLGFESLSLSPNRRHLYVASESALAQDAEGLSAGVEHFARLLHFEVQHVPRLVEQLLYPLTMPGGGARVHGLVELLALDDAGRLLALERSWGPELGMAVKLFEIRLTATRQQADRSTLSPAAKALPVLHKQLILDFSELPIVLDNFESLTLGPPLADGNETLIVLGDNDNTECTPPERLQQLRPTKFLLFELRR